MSREIKAKAFDEDRKVFVRARLIENESSNWIDERGFPVVWYTGLKDKNGVEIYESDLIELHGNKNGCVQVIFKNAYVGGWVLAEDEAGENYVSLGARDSASLEVIGNIYETPELLEDK